MINYLAITALVKPCPCKSAYIYYPYTPTAPALWYVLLKVMRQVIVTLRKPHNSAALIIVTIRNYTNYACMQCVVRHRINIRFEKNFYFCLFTSSLRVKPGNLNNKSSSPLLHALLTSTKYGSFAFKRPSTPDFIVSVK